MSAVSPPLPREAVDAGRVRALWRLIGATSLIVLGFSTVQPLLAVLLQQRGVPASAIGLFATLPFLTIALMLPVLPRAFARLGVARAYRGGLLLQTVAVVGYVLHDGYGWWCACSVIGSIGIAAEWNGTEAMVAFNAPPATRGRVTGMYQTLLGAALALGPLLPTLAEAAWPDLSPRALLLAAPLIFIAALPLATVPVLERLPVARPDARSATLWTALRLRPALVWIAFAGGVFETGLASISAAHGAQLGLSVAAATSIAGALGFGSFLLQYPAGWLADRLPISRVVGGAGVLLLIGTVAFASSGSWSELLWVSAFLWGAVGGALYTLAMVRVSHDFAASSAIAGAAAMISGYTVGGALGPIAAGLALEQSGVAGLAGWLALLATSVLLAARRGAAEPPPGADGGRHRRRAGRRTAAKRPRAKEGGREEEGSRPGIALRRGGGLRDEKTGSGCGGSPCRSHPPISRSRMRAAPGRRVQLFCATGCKKRPEPLLRCGQGNRSVRRPQRSTAARHPDAGRRRRRTPWRGSGCRARRRAAQGAGASSRRSMSATKAASSGVTLLG